MSEANTAKKNGLEVMQLIQQTIPSLNDKNINQAFHSIISIFNEKYVNSFNITISRIIYTYIDMGIADKKVYFDFMKEIEKFEETKKIETKIFKIFSDLLLKEYTQKSLYFIEYMIKEKLMDSKKIDKLHPYFIHHSNEEEFNKILSLKSKYIIEIKDNIKELTKNDWELHKKLIAEGHNPNEIAKIIRNDEIEKLQEISSQTNFNYNQKIEPSLYERCDFVNKENVTLIDYAAFFGSVKCFKYLLLNGSEIDDTGEYAIAGGNLEIIHLCEQYHSSYENAYETAIKFHQNDIFKYLYENKIVEINDLENLGKKCITYYDYDLFLYLKENGMKINDDIINESARIGNIIIVKYFLKEYQLPKKILIFSAKSGVIELVKCVLKKKGIDVNLKDNELSALMWATVYNYIEIVKLLLQQKGIDVNIKDKDKNTVLMHASIKGFNEIVKLLLEQKGIDINAKNSDGNTALMWPSSKDHIEIVKLLLKQKGIDINAKNKLKDTALMYASENGHTEIVKLLLEQEGIDFNAKDSSGNTALMQASWKGYTEIVKLLLEQKGIDINAKNKNLGNTALMIASENGHTEIVELLLEQKGIDINAKNNNENTALIRASEKGYTEIVKLLLEHKNIDVNAKDENGNTVLIKASLKDHIDIVKLLLEQKGIDVNSKNKFGNTALIIASKNGYIEIVKLLLEQKGIDINAKDKYGKTAAIYASQKGYNEIVKYLCEQEGIINNSLNKEISSK